VLKLCATSQGHPALGSRRRAMMLRSRWSWEESVIREPSRKPQESEDSVGLGTNLCTPTQLHISHNVYCGKLRWMRSVRNSWDQSSTTNPSKPGSTPAGS